MPQDKKDRDYRKEYDNYHGKPKQRKQRSQRNKARRKMAKKGKVRKGDGKEVDHRVPLSKGGSNHDSNLSVKSRTENRKKYTNGSSKSTTRKAKSSSNHGPKKAKKKSWGSKGYATPNGTTKRSRTKTHSGRKSKSSTSSSRKSSPRQVRREKERATARLQPFKSEIRSKGVNGPKREPKTLRTP